MNKQLLDLLSIYYIHSKSRSSSQSGFALFIVMALVLASLSLLAVNARLTQVESRRTIASSQTNATFYAAEAQLNERVEEFRQKLFDFRVINGASPQTPQACLDENSSNDGSNDFACNLVTYQPSTQGQSSVEAASYVVPLNGGNPIEDTVPPGEPFQGLSYEEFTYSIHSIAKDSSADDAAIETSLKMDIRVRVIPTFQFAAFFDQHLEIASTPEPLTLNGPVHTNKSLNLKGADIRIFGQVTAGKGIWHRFAGGFTLNNELIRIADVDNNLQILVEKTGRLADPKNAGGTVERNEPIDPDWIESVWGRQIEVDLEPVLVPQPDFLDRSGTYFGNADIRVDYRPAATSPTNTNYLNAVPFSIEARQPDGTYVDLNEGQLRSLRQPVLVSREVARAGYCTPVTAPNIDAITADDDVKRFIVESLQTAIASQQQPLRFSQLDVQLSNSIHDRLRDDFESILDDRLASMGLSAPSNLRDLADYTPNDLAAIAFDLTDVTTVPAGERCFVPAPLYDLGRDQKNHDSLYRFLNNREGIVREAKDMRLLQINLASLTIWNRDGIYVAFNRSGVSNNNNGQGFGSGSILFERAAPDPDAPANSFQALGLAGSDLTDGGLVFHASIDQDNYDATIPGPILNISTGSPYGFVLTEGRQLMGLAETTNNIDNSGLTFASDQAVYIQGDYNLGRDDTFVDSSSIVARNKQPAAILADTINILSNACLNADRVVHKLNDVGCDTGSSGQKVLATPTSVNAGFLSGSPVVTAWDDPPVGEEISTGGLGNYPRFHENWGGGVTFYYRGSFVSLGAPNHVNGRWFADKPRNESSSCTDAEPGVLGDPDTDCPKSYVPPVRDWGFDTSFNTPANLPPLAPTFTAITQSSFERYLD